jgi:hypothetical protein
MDMEVAPAVTYTVRLTPVKRAPASANASSEEMTRTPSTSMLVRRLPASVQ